MNKKNPLTSIARKCDLQVKAAARPSVTVADHYGSQVVGEDGGDDHQIEIGQGELHELLAEGRLPAGAGN